VPTPPSRSRNPDRPGSGTHIFTAMAKNPTRACAGAARWSERSTMATTPRMRGSDRNLTFPQDVSIRPPHGPTPRRRIIRSSSRKRAARKETKHRTAFRHGLKEPRRRAVHHPQADVVEMASGQETKPSGGGAKQAGAPSSAQLRRPPRMANFAPGASFSRRPVLSAQTAGQLVKGASRASGLAVRVGVKKFVLNQPFGASAAERACRFEGLRR